MRARCSAHREANAVDAKRNVSVGNPLQRSAAQFPKQGSWSRRRERLDRFLSCHIWPQTSNRTDFHRHQPTSTEINPQPHHCRQEDTGERHVHHVLSTRFPCQLRSRDPHQVHFFADRSKGKSRQFFAVRGGI